MIDALVSGRLIKDPALRTGASGRPFCNFLLSVPVGDGEPVVVSAIAFGPVAERIAKLGKGDAVAVTGSLKPTEWIDKNSGELKHGLTVTVQDVLTPYDIRKRRGNTDKPAEGAPQSRQQSPNGYAGYPEYDDPIEF